MRVIESDTVLSTADARRAGWTDSALARAVRAERIVRLRHGFFAGARTTRTEAIAAVRSCSGAVACHRSGGTMHGLPLLGRRDFRPDVTVDPTGTGDLSGANLHRATLWDEDIVYIDGIAVTSVARTIIDLARTYPIAAAVVPLDAALHRRLTTRAELDAVVLRCWNWPGIRRVHRVLDSADARAESPLESISRLVISWLRLPRPEPQLVIGDSAGRFVARADFGWDELGVVGEADGKTKYTGIDGPEVLYAEKLRQESLAKLGLVIVRWDWNDVVYRPRRLRERLLAAFAQAENLHRSGSPRKWSILRAESTISGEDVIEKAERAAISGENVIGWAS